MSTAVLCKGDMGSRSATPELDEQIKLRSPYVAPLNILQVRGKGQERLGGL